MSKLRLFIGVVVTVVWAAAWIAAIVRDDYGGAGSLTPLLLLVVGGIFSDSAIKMIRNGKGERNGG